MTQHTQLPDYDLPYLESQIRKRLPDMAFSFFTSVTSTNDLAKKLGSRADAPRQGLLLAETQTSGRGRRERSFYSPPGQGIYMTLYFKQALDPAFAALLPFYVALSAAEALQSFSFPVGIKWVNDLMLFDGSIERKVGGILCESRLGPQEALWICGLGINVAETAISFPAAIEGSAGTLVKAQQAANGLPDRLREDLVLAITDKIINKIYNPGYYMAEYKRHCLSLNREVEVKNFSGEMYTAYVVDLDEEGHLLVCDCFGVTRSLATEEISILHS